MSDFRIKDHTRDRFIDDIDSRNEGDEKLEEFKGKLELELISNGHTVAKNFEDEPEDKADGGETVEPDVVDHSEPETTEEPATVETETAPSNAQEPMEQETEALEQLGESIDTDPLDILPGYMITPVDGKPSLNKRGVSVLAYQYGVSVVERETVVYPHETDYTSAAVEITVKGEDGRVFFGSGEAHADETPKHQLLRMAETRAYKRAVIFATGTGIVGYQEIMEELQ